MHWYIFIMQLKLYVPSRAKLLSIFLAIKAYTRTKKENCPVAGSKKAALPDFSWKHSDAYQIFVAKFRRNQTFKFWLYFSSKGVHGMCIAYLGRAQNLYFSPEAEKNESWTYENSAIQFSVKRNFRSAHKVIACIKIKVFLNLQLLSACFETKIHPKICGARFLKVHQVNSCSLL